ncbi:MAG: MFS transporter [Desulfovibrio sp.]|nr:MFS transporter [Desulfovibrio sp.]
MFYGWKLAALITGGNFMLQGSAVYCMNAFMEPLCEVNGWTRAGLNLSMGLAVLAGQLAMPLAAAVSARRSLRLLTALGALAGGAATLGMGMTSSLALYTLWFILVWVCAQFCGGVVGNALISRWFRHFQGRAFGVANAGSSLAGVMLPFFCMALIHAFGVTAAYSVLGVVTCLLGPLAWWLVRDEPQALGLHPDGRRHEPHMPKAAPVNTSFAALIHSRQAWFVGIAYGLALMTASTFMSQMKPRFADLGLEAWPAMLLACLSALFAALAKYAWGWVSDRTSPLVASRLIMAMSVTSVALLLLPPSLPLLALFSVAFGGCIGGLWTVLPAVVSWYFGSQNFLAAYKFIAIILILRCAGFPVMAASHGLFGSYVLADAFFGASLLTALVLTFLLRPGDAVGNTHHRR